MRKQLFLFLSSCPEINTENGGGIYKDNFLLFIINLNFWMKLTYSFCVKRKAIMKWLVQI